MISFILGPVFIVLMLAFGALSAWAASRVKGTFAKYNKTPIASGVTGAEAAQMILHSAGIHDVKLEGVQGMLSDHYDPSAKTVRLSMEVLNGRTPAAVAVAAHEVGHALQHAQAYAPMSMRASLVPAVNLTSRAAIPLIMIGYFAESLGLAWLGVFAFSFAVLFHLVTLPVEFDASRRATAILEKSGIANANEMIGVRKTLNAAGFTYVASAVAALGQLLYFLLPLLTGSDD